jgi:hypothetical protein
LKVLKQNLANKLEIAQSSYGVVQKTLSQISSFVNLNPSGPRPSENLNNNSNINNNNNFLENFQGDINPDLLNLANKNSINSNDNINNEISSKLNNNNSSETINEDDWDESNLN